MSLNLFWDPLFREPLLVGLVLVPLLAVLGCWVRLRGEWLAALGYAHVAGAGGVLAAAVHLPMLPVATTATLMAGAVKACLGRAGNEAFAVMILLGWCAALLLAANHPRAEVLGRVFMDGQLLFSGPGHLGVALGLAVLAVVVMPWLSPRLLRHRFQPRHYRANGLSVWPFGLVFDAMVVLMVAAGALAMGVMASFAAVMVPAWIAWRHGRGWRGVLWISGLLALVAYLAAFLLSLSLDQPFGPVMVACLLALVPLRWFRLPA